MSAARAEEESVVMIDNGCTEMVIPLYRYTVIPRKFSNKRTLKFYHLILERIVFFAIHFQRLWKKTSGALECDEMHQNLRLSSVQGLGMRRFL